MMSLMVKDVGSLSTNRNFTCHHVAGRPEQVDKASPWQSSVQVRICLWLAQWLWQQWNDLKWCSLEGLVWILLSQEVWCKFTSLALLAKLDQIVHIMTIRLFHESVEQVWEGQCKVTARLLGQTLTVEIVLTWQQFHRGSFDVLRVERTCACWTAETLLWYTCTVNSK